VDNELKWDWIWVKEEKKYSKRLDCRKEVDLFEIEAEVQEKKEVINERGDDDEPDNEPRLIEVKPMAITTTGLGERPGPGSMSTGPSSMTTMFSSIVPVPAVDLEFSSSSKPTSKPKKNKNRGYGEEEIFNLSSFLGDFAGNDDYYEDEGFICSQFDGYSCVPSNQCTDGSEVSDENGQYCEDPSQKCCHESHHNLLRIDFDTFLALINK